MTKLLKTFLTDDTGATAIEYGLIAALVSIAAITTLQTLGTSLNSIFGVADDALQDAIGTDTGGAAG